MQYCSLQHRILLLSLVTCTTGYCFYFGSTPSFFLELYIGHLPTWGVPLSVSFFPFQYHFSFSYCSWCFKARILKWFASPFSSGPHSVRPLHHDPSLWVATWAWLRFTELKEPEIKLPTSTRSSKAREFQKNIYLCFIDYAKFWNNRLVSNRKRRTSRLYTVTLLI